MKWLRSCGVRNVNVLVDGHYYSELMDQISGEEMALSPGYSLYPVFNKSIFHPKIWMLFGEKEGLLLVGSGNLTNTGNGNNDEIWGAFHFDMRFPDNSQIFSVAWQYIQNMCSTLKGFTHQKTTQWITENSRWLNELPPFQQATWQNTLDGGKIAFLANSSTSTIWTQVLDLLRNEVVTEITAISPFYDKNGKALQALGTAFPKSKVRVVIDSTWAIPSDMPVTKEFSFYDWYNVGVSRTLHSKTENTSSKLHAKIVHFKTKAGREYCLFGSANVTPEGLGLPGSVANSEVSLLVQNKEPGLLSRLDIKLTTTSKLTDFRGEKDNSLYESILNHSKQPIRIQAAEQIYNELFIYSQGKYPSEVSAKFFDQEGKYISVLALGEYRTELSIKHTLLSSSINHLQLFDTNTDVSISNKILISDYVLLAKTHPNKKAEDIERIYSEVQNGELAKVLDLLPYALMDESEASDMDNIFSHKTATPVKTKERFTPDEVYDLSKYKTVEKSSFEKSLLLSSLSLRVLDILKAIQSDEFGRTNQAEIRVDEQEEDLDSISGVSVKELPLNTNQSLTILKQEKRKLVAYFDRISDNQERLAHITGKPFAYKPSLTDITKYLIALELMNEFGGRTAKYVDKDKEHFFNYLNNNREDNYNNDCLKGCCLNVIGGFLMLAHGGFKEYTFEYTKSKLAQLKRDALLLTIACILNTRWDENEYPYFNTLLLNCLHYIGERNPKTFASELPELLKDVSLRVSRIKYQSFALKNNFSWFTDKIVPAFKETISRLSLKNFDSTSTTGQIIYKSPWGYCFVKKVTINNEFTLVRPGFLWNDKHQEYMMHTNDEIYQPLLLTAFINVAI